MVGIHEKELENKEMGLKRFKTKRGPNLIGCPGSIQLKKKRKSPPCVVFSQFLMIGLKLKGNEVEPALEDFLIAVEYLDTISMGVTTD
jgi:hypothetical protein